MNVLFLCAFPLRPIYGSHLRLHTTFIGSRPPKASLSPGAVAVTRDQVMARIAQGNVTAQIQIRPPRFMFGAVNYGELPDFINRADGDPWDIVVPGYGRALPEKTPLAVASIIGWLRLENGNDKLFVRLKRAPPGYRFNAQKARSESRRYATTYMKTLSLRGKYQYWGQ